jgi:hypothetical protein
MDVLRGMLKGRMDSLPAAVAANIEYAFRPRIVGGDHVFRLTPAGLVWEGGGRSRLIPYRDIISVRLSYRPGNIVSNRFLTEIWPREGGKVALASVSTSGPFSFEDRGEAYTAFVTELGRRIDEAQPGFRFEMGMPAWRWWPAVVFAGITLSATAYFLGYAFMTGQIKLIFLVLAFAGLFCWQMGTMLFRNRRRICEIKSIPAAILPRKR